MSSSFDKPELRTIVEEHWFMDQIDALAVKYERAREPVEGVKWELARNPKRHTPVGGYPGYYMKRTIEFGATPSFLVVFQYDEQRNPNEVYLVAIVAITQEE
jgi:hypothetical protein